MDTKASYGLDIGERTAPASEPFLRAIKVAERQIRVALPAIVQSFDAATQTVKVTIAIRENTRISGALTTLDSFILESVPLVLPRAGGFTLTLPIKAGDECLVVFADLAIDSWWLSGGSNNKQVEERRHNLSDGFAILGTWSQPRILAAYNTTAAELRNDAGTALVRVAGSQIDVIAPTVNVTATQAATVSGATVNVTGSTTVTVSGNNTTKIDGKAFLLHTHSGVASGGSTSGPVV